MSNETVPNLPNLATSLSTYLTGSNADGLMGKIAINTLKSVIGVAANITLSTAIPSTNPGAAVGNRMWVASQAGTYTNFAGIVIAANEAAFLVDTGSTFSKVTIPVDLANYIQAGQVVDNLSTSTTTLPLSANQGRILNNAINAIAVPGTEQAGSPLSGFLTSTGAFSASASWRATDFLPATPGTVWYYKGLTSGSAFAAMAYNSSQIFMSTIFSQVDYHLNYQSLTVPAGAAYLRFSARMTGGDVFSVLSPSLIPAALLTGYPALQTTVAQNQTNIGYLVTSQDYAQSASLGYISTTGAFVAAANWRATPFAAVKAGDKIQYKGNASQSAVAVAAYDSNQGFLSILYDADDTAVLTDINIPSGVAYIRASARMLAGDSFVANVINFKIGTAGTGTEDIKYFAPKLAWAKQGDEFRMYPGGIVGKNYKDRHIDVLTDMINSNEDFISYSPASGDNDKVIKTYLRGLDGGLTLMGNTTVKITHVTQSPASAVNVICLGDSLTLGVTSAGIQGAYPNEFCRRLTGTGTALMTGAQSPAALSLTNIYFRGTLGDQPIKHEGRAGWGINTYLTLASQGADTNAFWNSGTSQFDLNYYLTQNNFNSDQTTGGVDATGSNLVIYLFLGWNHVYTTTVAQAQTWLNQLLDLIHTQKSGCKIKLLGMQTPPDRNLKSTRGSVSPEQVMREAIIPYAEAWQASAEARSSFVEFVPMAPFFHPENSYPTIIKAIHPRSATTYLYNTDYVHPDKGGYAQIADVCYYNFIYNYCRLS